MVFVMKPPSGAGCLLRENGLQEKRATKATSGVYSSGDELTAAIEVDAGAKVITLDDYGTAIYFIEQGEADVLTEGGEAELERSLRRLGLERAGR
jgi:hypothetical protein